MTKVEWHVPRNLEEAPRVLFLDPQQLVCLLVLTGLGIALGSMLAGLVAGIIMVKVYSRLRAGRHPRFIMHLAYWHLPGWVLNLRQLPPAHLRLFVG